MRDLIRFVVRGAIGGALYPFLTVGILFGPVLGYAGLLVFFGFIYLFLAPGAFVGLVLWICSYFVKRLSARRRFILGTLIHLGIISILNVADLISTVQSLILRPENIPLQLVILGLYAGAIGGLAGVACPEGNAITREPTLDYWQRVRLYEAAEVEAQAARKKHLAGGL